MACHISVYVHCTYNRFWLTSGSSVGDMYSTPSLSETFWLDLEGGAEGDSEQEKGGGGGRKVEKNSQAGQNSTQLRLHSYCYT